MQTPPCSPAASPYADNRTTALLGASVDLLERLNVWPRCHDQAAALRTMRLVDDTGRLIRAPEVRFSSDEIGLEQFGYNIDNRSLMVALEARAAELSDLTRFDDEAVTIDPQDATVAIQTGKGEHLAARLVVGADGRQSLSRQAAGIEISRRDLHQSALTFNIAHSRPHDNVSTEFHTPQGPCVFVPLPGNRCSVVWVSAPREAERLMSLSDDELSEAAEKQSHSILGRVQVEAGRNLFAADDRAPRQFASHRVALVGESAHVVPPIGAQGLNMGLRDAADIADIVGNAISLGEDPGIAAGAGALPVRPPRRCRQPADSRSMSPTAPCSAIFCRCSRCARPECICSARSARYAGWPCARAWRRPGSA